ncbi:unnamed protein product [Caenorhabditis angaria]|uniref:NTF2-like domain-containing protein n=1 Tax=Caenorhabditis angaria TaxID=860376 RepID=A0A9P1ICP8_9PELO|nr:unnamed protein product [Caenorhabditis angaria]
MRTLFIVLVFLAITGAFKIRIHSEAQAAAEKIAKKVEDAIATKNSALVAKQFHHDFVYRGCRNIRKSRAQVLKDLSKLPENFEYSVRVIDAKRIGSKTLKYSLEWSFGNHISTYEFVARKHHGEYVLERATRTDCHLYL